MSICRRSTADFEPTGYCRTVESESLCDQGVGANNGGAGRSRGSASVVRRTCHRDPKEVGCINYELLQRTDNPCELVLAEEWESQEHLDAHTHTEHFVRLVEALDKLETAAPAQIFTKVL